jgi:hypothetical protein
MPPAKHSGILDGIVDRSVTIDGKVYYAGDRVKPYLGRFHEGDTVVFTVSPKDRGVLDTMFAGTVPASQVKNPEPAGGAPAAPAGQPAVTPPPAANTAPAAAPAATPPKPVGKLPQENREERICRECCLKCAVEMLKDQPGFIILTERAQENQVVETAQAFFVYAMNGTAPGKEG